MISSLLENKSFHFFLPLIIASIFELVRMLLFVMAILEFYQSLELSLRLMRFVKQSSPSGLGSIRAFQCHCLID